MSSSHRGRTSRRRSRGQGLVEFALVAPLLLALAFGIFDFGRGMSANVTVTNASREGARWIALNASTLSSPYGSSCPNGTTAPSSSSGQLAAWNQMLDANLNMSAVTMTVYFYKSTNNPASDTTSGHTHADLTVTCSAGTATVTTGSNTGDSTYVPQTGDWVEFRVQYTYTTTTPIIHQLVPTVSIDQTTTMVLE